METTTVINNFEDLHIATQNNPLHILTGACEGWETLSPETKVNLDKLIDLPLPEDLDFYPDTLHLYSNPDQLLEDIKHNIQLTDFKDLGGDDSFYDYIPDRISCIIQGFESLKPIYPEVISSLAHELSESMQQASQYLSDSEFNDTYIDQFIPKLSELINQ